MVSIVGGQSINEQGFRIKQGCEVVIATPGRLIDCLERCHAILNQCPKNDLEREQTKNIPYASAVGSLMYAQVCTRPDDSCPLGVSTDSCAAGAP